MHDARFTLRRALPEDAAAVTACVDAAYRPYVDRIGMRPGPMLEDYAGVIARRNVTVADVDGTVAGLVVLAEGEEGFLVENVASASTALGRRVRRPPAG